MESIGVLLEAKCCPKDISKSLRIQSFLLTCCIPTLTGTRGTRATSPRVTVTLRVRTAAITRQWSLLLNVPTLGIDAMLHPVPRSLLCLTDILRCEDLVPVILDPSHKVLPILRLVHSPGQLPSHPGLRCSGELQPVLAGNLVSLSQKALGTSFSRCHCGLVSSPWQCRKRI